MYYRSHSSDLAVGAELVGLRGAAPYRSDRRPREVFQIISRLTVLEVRPKIRTIVRGDWPWVSHRLNVSGSSVLRFL